MIPLIEENNQRITDYENGMKSIELRVQRSGYIEHRQSNVTYRLLIIQS